MENTAASGKMESKHKEFEEIMSDTQFVNERQYFIGVLTRQMLEDRKKIEERATQEKTRKTEAYYRKILADYKRWKRTG